MSHRGTGVKVAAATVCTLVLLACGCAHAAGPFLGGRASILGTGNGKMLVKALNFDYDTKTGVMTATGKVEIDYNGRILMADKITYDGNKDIATADGNVVMMAPNGDVAFARHAELTNEMRDGVVDAFSARFGKYSRFAAVRARREANGTVLAGTRVAFTPCKICAKNGNKTPVWQVAAASAVHSDVTHKITYRDAILEMFGVPVAWTPYFSQGDGTVKHATGILAPELGTSSLLGSFIKVPFYVAFSDSEDMTFAPLVSTKGGEQLEGEYRQRFMRGGMWLQASVADDPHGGPLQNEDQTYSSLFGSGAIWLDDIWHVGYDAQLTSNATYLQRYSLSPDQRLVSDIYLEGISGRSRFEIKGYYFQGLLSEDNPREFPVVLPLIEYTYIPQKPVLGGDFRFDLNTAALTRSGGIDDPAGNVIPQVDSQRATAEVNWKLPLVTGNGQLITFQADARGDVYRVLNIPNANAAPGAPHPVHDDYIYRGLPYVAVDWRWPFISQVDGGLVNAVVVEPIVQAIAAPYGGNPAGLPNDDSQDFELNEMDIFSVDPVPGYDLVETGPRANIGLRTQAFFPSGNAEFIVGQQLRLKPDPIFAADTGLEGRTSDIVSRLAFNFPPHFSFVDRVDVDSDFGTVRRNEVYATASFGHTSMTLSYLRLPPSELEPGTDSREEINGQATLGITDYWLVYAAARRDLESSQMLYSEYGIGYEDECLGFSIAYRRQYVRDRDIPPSTSILLKVDLKTNANTEDIYNIFPRFIFSEEQL